MNHVLEVSSCESRFAHTFVVPSKQVTVIKTDEADNRILEAAVEASADYIVSGDTDLLRLRRFGDIAIVSPKTFLEEQFPEI